MQFNLKFLAQIKVSQSPLIILIFKKNYSYYFKRKEINENS